MNGSLLSIHLSDEQATELQNALCSRRDHYVELLNGPGTETSAARPEVERYWKGKVQDIQTLIDSISVSLYGAQENASISARTSKSAEALPNIYEAPD
ncbi:hypothetical protein [Glutamicibacter sp. BW77]|uniref:WXG100 family type VII secretion target n=1 Tax=Glutamicibacter bergerei TaxID=256702 RepID=A0ABV9MPF0_9MICC|nr:hypothetical protein [Glutamicibacter sp. BW77]PCC36560.1 hypothetical protein CIK74_05265 [Glutamicibacter sp. BW77]